MYIVYIIYNLGTRLLVHRTQYLNWRINIDGGAQKCKWIFIIFENKVRRVRLKYINIYIR